MRNHTRAVCLFLGPPGQLDPNRPLATVALKPSFDWFWLLPYEPDFPNDAPSPRELAFWFAWCIAGVFGGAGVIAGVVGLAAWMVRSSRPVFWARAAFTSAAFLLGLAGTTLFSAWAGAFVLTWPASLYVAFRLLLGRVDWVEAQPGKKWLRRVSRALALLFMALCYGYYQLCLAVGYIVAWSFLTGFVPAAPAAILALRTRRLWLRVLAEATAFTAFFWVSGMLPAWKDRWFGRP